MPLELRWKLSGRLRPFWYGRYEVNGKRFCPNLGVKIAGTPPASMSLTSEGDTAFERSRAAAQAKLDSIVDEARSSRNAASLVEKLYEIKTGERIKSVKLTELADEWAKISRKRKPDKRYASQCQSILRRFVNFVQSQNSNSKEISQVTPTVARQFMDAEETRGIVGKTWNDVLKLLRSSFSHLLPEGTKNPFRGLATKSTETVFRKPFTSEELKEILEVIKDDEFIRPVIVTGICTAMRRGDCCLLNWKNVDLENKFIAVKTNKTGVWVDIPIFPLLLGELSALHRASRLPDDEKGNNFVFPAQAKMYLENPDGITWRVKKVLSLALGKPIAQGETFPETSPEEATRRGLEYVASLPPGEKTMRMRQVFELYMSGKTSCDVAASAEVSKGSVSGYLNAIEAKIGCRIVRGHTGESLTSRLKNDRAPLSVERETGGRSASVRGFHSFRVTWVTLALNAGVPMELVQRVTGHKTVDIVLKHYYQPRRKDFRRTLDSAMPQLFSDGQTSIKEQMRIIIQRTTPLTFPSHQAQLLDLLEKL